MSGTPTRILLADDQDDVRSGFRLVLDSQPDTTVIGEAADGATALELPRPSGGRLPTGSPAPG